MNWQLAWPEIVLAVCGMAILIFGVLRKKQDNSFACSMLTVGAFLLAALLVLSQGDGLGYQRTFHRRSVQLVPEAANPRGRRAVARALGRL